MEGRSDITSVPTLERAGSNGFAGPLMTAGEVAELLGVPRSWVYEQSRRGLIPTVSLGRYRRYRREAIESWIREIEDGTASLSVVPGAVGPADRGG